MEKTRAVEKDPQIKKDDLILITGAGGFIAGNLALYFKQKMERVLPETRH